MINVGDVYVRTGIRLAGDKDTFVGQRITITEITKYGVAFSKELRNGKVETHCYQLKEYFSKYFIPFSLENK